MLNLNSFKVSRLIYSILAILKYTSINSCDIAF